VVILDVKPTGITHIPVVEYFVAVCVRWVLAATSAGCLSQRETRDNATIVKTWHITLLGSSHLGDVLWNASWRIRILYAFAKASTVAASAATTSPLMTSMSLSEAPCWLLNPSILLLQDVDIGYREYMYVAACRQGLIVDRKSHELLHHGCLICRELLDCCCHFCGE
jgi:hypothetical protein